MMSIFVYVLGTVDALIQAYHKSCSKDLRHDAELGGFWIKMRDSLVLLDLKAEFIRQPRL